MVLEMSTMTEIEDARNKTKGCIFLCILYKHWRMFAENYLILWGSENHTI